MIPLTDEDYCLAEPCVSCEHIYVEDIWHEWCCDKKRCVHSEEYKNSEKFIKENGND